jgi:hypothetical protein
MGAGSRLLLVVADRKYISGTKNSKSSLQVHVWAIWVKLELVRKSVGRIHSFHVPGVHCGHPNSRNAEHPLGFECGLPILCMVFRTRCILGGHQSGALNSIQIAGELPDVPLKMACSVRTPASHCNVLFYRRLFLCFVQWFTFRCSQNYRF